MARDLSHSAAREIIASAWASVWGRAPTANELSYAQAIAWLETRYGRASGQFRDMAENGQYNWGALQRQPASDGSCPAGTVEGRDAGNRRCFLVFSSDEAAAAQFIRTLTKKHWPVVQAMKGTAEDVARAMRVPLPFYEGIRGSESEKVEDYASRIRGSLAATDGVVTAGGLSVLGVAAIGAGTYYAYRQGWLDGIASALSRAARKLA